LVWLVGGHFGEYTWAIVMGRIISIVNQKGGVGKTTTAINLGAYLAEAGKFVLIVDLDPQANATSGLGIDHRNLEQGVYQAILGNVRIREIVQPTAHETLRVAPSTTALAGLNIELVDMDRREYKLYDALLEIRNDYDYILIDCPPTLGLITLNGIVAADEVLIPVQAEYYALEGLGQLLETVQLVKERLRPELDVLGAVLTMYDGRTKLSDDVMQELYKYFPNNIFRSVIPRNVRLAEAPSFGRTIVTFDGSSKGARAYERLAQEILASEMQKLIV
jgi:chromosome partitioning protein